VIRTTMPDRPLAVFSRKAARIWWGQAAFRIPDFSDVCW
jgi:hypothetical protein